MSLQPNDVSDRSWLGKPIEARPLFGPELVSLLHLLRGLRRNEWNRAAVPGWTVHDLATHILGDYHGRLGWSTDSHQRAMAAGETLEAFLHRINQVWIDLHTDQSPAELIEALELAGTQVARQFEGTNLDTTGLGVSWAGADPAPKWLDIAREFTECWTHRQQIRHAIGKATDPEPNALRTVLDTFMRALPPHASSHARTLRDTTPGSRR
jgi:uncharacterized protein (TIGR03083 family)